MEMRSSGGRAVVEGVGMVRLGAEERAEGLVARAVLGRGVRLRLRMFILLFSWGGVDGCRRALE